VKKRRKLCHIAVGQYYIKLPHWHHNVIQVLSYFLVIGPLHMSNLLFFFEGMSNLPLMATYSCCINNVYPGLITTCHFLGTPLSRIVHLLLNSKQNYNPKLKLNTLSCDNN